MAKINDLPDGILVHILSFLSIDEAASTSLLSRRWRNMFVFSPFLDFSFTKPNRSLDMFHGQNVIDFVDRLLAVSANSTVSRLALICNVDSVHTHRWMRNVVNRGVLDLCIHAHYPIPSEVFSCKTLVKLQLINLVIPMLEDASLPALKSFDLSFVWFDSVHVFEKLISACPSLEELVVDQIYCEFWEFSSILSSLTLLKRLTAACYSRTLGRMSFDHPSLVFLEYAGHVHRQYPVVNLGSLVEAKLELVMTEPGNCDLSNLIKGLKNVKILHLLTNETVEIFGAFHEAMPIFRNLIHLSVSFPLYVCLPDSYVPSLLEKSPNLQTLVIKGPLLHNATGINCKCFLECSRLSSCPVKVLDLTVYEGSIKELKQMKHFLEVFTCLERVKVCSFAKDDKEKLRLTMDLLMLPKASSKCTILVKFS